MSRGEKIPLAIRAEIRERSGGRCEAGFAGCYGTATEVHHRKNRSQGGSNALVNLAHLCHACHHLVTIRATGTWRLRTLSWQKEGEHEPAPYGWECWSSCCDAKRNPPAGTSPGGVDGA